MGSRVRRGGGVDRRGRPISTPPVAEGDKYGQLTVVARSLVRPGYWICECACGNAKAVAAARLVYKQTTSCGHSRYRHHIGRHGESNSKGSGSESAEYRTWLNMKKGYPHLVCDSWKHSYESFLADVGRRPEGYHFQRFTPDSQYAPGQAGWLPGKRYKRAKQQNKN